MVLPAELPEPKRMKLAAPCRGALGGGARAAFRAIENDVGKLEDLEGFDVVGGDAGDRGGEHYGSFPSYFT